ncbi:MAG: DUF4340 domain-containing protein [Candidatus Latescibacteria bacterium]|nr:DUF4340 domain-containing protein [Candidatus Latescibacterota bacterium]
MRLKTNLVIGLVFAGLLAFVLYDNKQEESKQAQEEEAKQLLQFTDSEIVRLTVDRGDTLIVLEQTQGTWSLAAPVQGEADQDAVERYLRNIRETTRERVLEDSAAVAVDPAKGAQYQLQPPRLKVGLETAEGSLDSLYFGADSPTETFVYMQMGGANRQIFTTRAWRFDNLDKGVFDLRDRRVLAFDKDQMRQLSLLRGEDTFVLARDGENNWVLQTGVEVATDKAAVDRLVNKLHGASIEAFIEEAPAADDLGGYGLEPAGIEVSILLGEDRAEKKLYVGGAAGVNFFALDSSRKPVFTIDSTLVNQLLVDAADLRDKQPLDFDRQTVDRIELMRADGLLAATKDTASVWQITDPDVREAKSWKLNTLLTDLEEVEVETFLGDEITDLAPYGLDQPYLTLRLFAASELALEVHLQIDGDKANLTRSGSNSVYQVAGDVVTDLDLKLDDIAQPLPAD